MRLKNGGLELRIELWSDFPNRGKREKTQARSECV